MDKKFLPAALAAAVLALAGCGSSSSSSTPEVDPPPPPAETSTVRIVHASADAPNVNILIDGDVAFEDVSFLAATPLTQLDSGDYEIAVEGRLPGGEVATVIGPVTLAFEADTQYNVLAIGDVADESIEPLVLTQPANEIEAGNVRARVVHAAPGAPEVEVYVTAPGDLAPGEEPLGSFAFGEALDPVEVSAGDYQIRVAVPGDEPTVVFDSGAIALPDGADLLIVAVTNTGPGDSPITLLVSDGTDAFTLLDIGTPATLRVVHASPDAGNVDVLVDGAVVVSNLAFPEFTDYLSLAPGLYDVAVTPAGNPGVEAISVDDLELEIGTEYAVIAVGELAPATLDALLLVDDNRRIATEAKVRIVHGSPNAGAVDIYVTGAGEAIDDAEPAIAGFEFLEQTGYLSLAAGDYDVTVTAAGTTTPAIGPATITVEASGIYTAIARDPLFGEIDFGLILLDDFVLVD